MCGKRDITKWVKIKQEEGSIFSRVRNMGEITFINPICIEN